MRATGKSLDGPAADAASEPTQQAGRERMKWLSLALLVAHSVVTVVLLRVSRKGGSAGPLYLTTTAIVFAEASKFLGSLVAEYLTLGSATAFFAELREHFLARPGDCLRAAVPAVLYTVQNNLLFIAVSNLAAGTYQVTYQLKILTTAGMSVMILGTKLTRLQWGSLVFLMLGVACTGSSELRARAAATPGHGHPLLGLSAVGGACLTSGFTSVYLEKTMKQTTASLWMRNVQLAFFGMPVALATAFWFDGPAIRENGFMQGYAPLVWAVVQIQAIGGLIVAMSLKYADSILKCFGAAIGIVFTCLVSSFGLHELVFDSPMVLGLILVLASTSVYTLSPRALEARGGSLSETSPLLRKPLSCV